MCGWFLRTKLEAVHFMLFGVSASFSFFSASFCGEAEVVDIVEVTWRSLTGLALWFQWWPIVIFWAGSFITFILLPLLFLPFLSFVL